MSIVLVVGMHRSGTSMVTHLLTMMGFFAGETDELLAPNPYDNAYGYWENIEVMELNNDILQALGATWHSASSIEHGWENQDMFSPYIDRMLSIFNKQHSSKIVFKDPRMSITLPLWRKAFPDAKIIYCIRNPLEVILSLQSGQPARDFTFEEAMVIWEAYHDHLSYELNPEDGLWVNYQTFFYRPTLEVKRLADYLQQEIDEDGISQIASLIDPSQKHHKIPYALVDKGYPSTKIVGYYKDLCQLCGPHWQAFMNDYRIQHQIAMDYLKSKHTSQINQIRMLKKQLEAEQQTLENLQKQLEAEQQTLENLQKQLKRLTIAYHRAKHNQGISGIIQSIRDRIPLPLKWIKRVVVIWHSGYFDSQWYLAQYPDVQQANINPIWHYVKQGVNLGYNPNPNFDTKTYLSEHPEIVDSGMNPLIHYLQSLDTHK